MDAQKVFTDKGAIHILVELGDGPKSFDDLHERIPVSSRTLNRRLRQASGERQALWNPSLARTGDGSATRVWELTDRGRRYYEHAKSTEVIEASKELRRIQRDFESAREKFIRRL